MIRRFPGFGLGRVFAPNEVGEPVKYWRVHQAWKDTCAAAEITGLHFHDLRRELASTLRESGAPDHIVADVLGHANISTTSRYLKASRAGLTTYVQQFEAHRAQQKKAAAKQAAAKAGRIRTPFAQGGAEGRLSTPETAVKNRAKSLN